jgi:hypothetical protein
MKSPAEQAMEALSKHRKKLHAPKPKDWFTREEYEIENKVSRTKALQDIMKLAAVGALQTDRWLTQDTMGRTIYRTIYKLNT